MPVHCNEIIEGLESSGGVVEITDFTILTNITFMYSFFFQLTIPVNSFYVIFI